MAKDVSRETTLDDLTDAEIERIEGLVFCAGGPPGTLTACMILRATGRGAVPALIRRAA